MSFSCCGTQNCTQCARWGCTAYHGTSLRLHASFVFYDNASVEQGKGTGVAFFSSNNTVWFVCTPKLCQASVLHVAMGCSNVAGNQRQILERGTPLPFQSCPKCCSLRRGSESEQMHSLWEEICRAKLPTQCCERCFSLRRPSGSSPRTGCCEQVLFTQFPSCDRLFWEQIHLKEKQVLFFLKWVYTCSRELHGDGALLPLTNCSDNRFQPRVSCVGVLSSVLEQLPKYWVFKILLYFWILCSFAIFVVSIYKDDSKLIFPEILWSIFMLQQLFNCQALRKLSIPDNDLSSLPTTIASLVNLRELDISKNGKRSKGEVS